jgi:hypothetical protein
MEKSLRPAQFWILLVHYSAKKIARSTQDVCGVLIYRDDRI